jgi:glutamate/tyrosine decarboxylase-like PLP-dependent enzyme
MAKKVIRFPEMGLDAGIIMSSLKELKSHDASWRDGHMFGYIYHASERQAKIIKQVYRMSCNENALNPSLFSSLSDLRTKPLPWLPICCMQVMILPVTLPQVVRKVSLLQ